MAHAGRHPPTERGRNLRAAREAACRPRIGCRVRNRASARCRRPRLDRRCRAGTAAQSCAETPSPPRPIASSAPSERDATVTASRSTFVSRSRRSLREYVTPSGTSSTASTIRVTVEVAEEEPARHQARRRKPTPRTVSIQSRVAQLSAQRRDVHVDRLRRPEPARLPDVLEDPLPADRSARVGREQREQVELARRELRAVAPSSVTRRAATVDHESVDPHRRHVAGPEAPARRITAWIRATSSRSPYGLTM